ncbi:non-ribosomal peptide synthetase/type I polyketide synthase [Amycolatopsis sp. 195334CR]|uniref:non-ribosomal peptide synthetase/type I polyketide synthase n=1 Tax=Amycolatopsis sp. 195334CR TaxID=2814588 RepID=UPI001A8D323F|nr:non-ribosomal peptide synthetase/type I polyketide synthase [Amycolatopsis sp. 195334CR]MBN6039850.1 amino acid adenylation domain-containing protein [Amycolatopsis sp. 195334CR]
MQPTVLQSWLVRQIASRTGLDPDAVDRDAPLTGYGLSSRDAVLLIGELGELLKMDLSATLFWDHPTINALTAHLTGQETPAAPRERAAAAPDEPIAVIGLGCRFPGAASPAEFWDLLDRGGDGIADPARRTADLGRTHGLLRDVHGFDAGFFSISGREVSSVDPQQRLLLELAWEALEHAGIAPTSLAGTRTGVFVGISTSDHARGAELTAHSGTGQALSIAANRLSYFLDLKGPSLAVDTACSSSLVAVHLACRSLRAGEAETALAGGVNLLLSPELTEVFGQAGMLAEDGRCKTFDAAADGYVRAEGGGVVVLKTLSAAQRDGDRVLAVLRGSAVNQDGRSNGLTAPSGAAQQAVIREALADAGLTPADIDYVEAHGTGTPLGDPIETRALTAVLTEPFLLGSVKTNIGHTEAAAGIAGLIKVVLMLRHRRVPAHLHLRERNREIAAGPFEIPESTRDWTPRTGPLTAGVSSFGFGGTNAHVIVAEPTGTPAAPSGSELRPRHVATLSARTETALRALAADYAELDNPHVRDLCFTTNTGRAHLRHRAAFTASTTEELRDRLTAIATGQPGTTVHIGQKPPAGPGGLAFLFSGQGAQYAGMARQLYATSARFRGLLGECGELFGEHVGTALPTLLFSGDRLDETRYTQPALFCLEYALARLWESWGARPDYLLGHSVGQFAAACVAGVFDLADGLRLVTERGRLVQELAEPGAMLAVFADETTVRAALTPGLAIAAVNGEENLTVSGEPAEIAALETALAARGIRTKAMRGTRAFHSPMMAPARDAFAEIAASITYREPRIPLISDLDGRPCTPDAAYWTRHLTDTVRFADGIRALGELGCAHFVETGPQQVLIGAGRRILPGRVWVPSLREGVDDWDVLTGGAARLFAHGRDLDWAAYHHGHRATRADLPTYPFERQPHRPAEETPVTPSTPRGEDPVLPVLAQVLATLLETGGPIDPDLSFLELGADSMTLFQTLQSVQRTFGVAVPINRLFEELNTLNRLADHIRAHAPADTLAPEPVAPAPVTSPVPEAGTEVGRFLEVHEKVMAQAYELMRGGPQTPAPAVARKEVRAVAPKDTFVAFAPKTAQKTAGHLTDAQRALAEDVVTRFCERTKGSKAQAARERAYHADVRHAPQPYLTLRESRYPLVVTKSSGSHVWDIDGNEYIDLTMGFGVNFFGHGEQFITDAITARLAEGMQLGPHSDLADDVSRLITEMTGKQRVVFCNTGSEAVMVAVRLARAITGRDKIALFAGAYHGSADPILARQDPSGESVPLAPGVPEDVSRNALVLTYGDDASLEVLRAHAGELAAVLVEPVQSRRPDQQPVEFLRQVRALTRETGVPLILDEVITGFRMHPGGVQGLWDIQADLTTYGKVVGGGLPIGVVAGDAKYLDAIDGGAWPFGDAPYPQSVRTFFSGTFCKHPLALAAGRAVLEEMRRRGPGLQEDLSNRVAALAARLDTMFTEAGVPIRVAQFGSLFRLRFLNEAPSSELVELFHTMLVAQGLYIWEGRNCFLSTAHTDADIERIVVAIASTVNQLTAAGFFPGARPALGTGDPDEGYPLSEVQREMWFFDQVSADHSRSYNESAVLDLRGELDVPALRAAVGDTIARHDSLHTVFAKDGSKQQVLPRLAIEVPLVELTADAVRPWFDARADEVFDLATGPLVKAAILRLAPDHHQLYLGVHHAVADGWSFVVLFEEIAHLYPRDATPLPPAPRYREFVHRQAAKPGDAAYWAEQFPTGLPALKLPTDRARDAQRISLQGGRVETRFTADRVTALSRELGVTPFTVLFAAYAQLMHQLSGQDDLVIGVPQAQRDHPGADRLVGNCSTLLPIRSRFDRTLSVREYVTRIQRTLVEAYAHPAFSTSALGARLNLDPRAQAVGTIFNVDRAPAVPRLAGLTTDLQRTTRRYTKIDLEVDVLFAGDQLTVTFEYNAELFDHTTVRRHARTYEELLTTFLDRPDARFDQLDPNPWNDTAHDLRPGTLPELFEAQAARTPEAVALVHDGESLTYAELDARADRLAGHLASLGAGPERIVVLALPRSTDLVVSVLAVLKAGAAYLPLDLDQPPARLAQLLGDSGADIVLATGETAGLLPAVDGLVRLDDVEFAEAELRRAEPANAAYVLYTSGSTGRPKGVVVTHEAVSNTLQWWQHEAGFGLGDRVLLKTPMTFDPSILEFFCPLFTGATLVVAEHNGHQDPAYLVSLIRETEVTCVQFVPTTLREFLAEPDAGECTSLETVMCAGEALPTALAEQCLDLLDAELYNLYGPTEASIDLTFWKARRGIEAVTVPIGRPLWNFRVHVLDVDLRPVPPGEAGELYVAGIGLARGYLGRPEVTATAFVPNPFEDGGARMYRTGDLVRWSEHGELEFLGRADTQVKLRGVRIELGEIEQALRALPPVADACVLVRDEQLVAYLAGDIDDPLDLVRSLRDVLPTSMIPAHALALASLPTLTSGKVDRRALAELPLPEPETTAAEPRTAAEERLLAIWTDVLGTPTGVHDDFFTHGGTSLSAMRLLTRVREELGHELTVRELFAAPTVAGLAARFAGHADTRPPLLPVPRDEPIPLSFAQARLWFLYRLGGPSPMYNIPMSFRLDGDLDTGALRAAFGDVVARHESLRTTVTEIDGVAVQHVIPADEATVDFAEGTPDEAAEHAFDLVNELPLRVRLQPVGPAEHVLTVVLHHIAGDAWSFGQLARDLAAAYEARLGGAAPEWTPLPVQYADYTMWQAELLGDEKDPDSLIARQLKFWKSALAGLPDELNLPYDRPRPAKPTQRGASLEFELGASHHSRLLGLARESGASFFMIAQAGLSTVLTNLGAGTDIPLGTPVAGRADTALDELIGFFANTVVLRTDTAGNPAFRELVARVREANLPGYAHQDVPFEHLVRVLNPPRSRSRHPLFQIMLVSENTEQVDVGLPGLRMREEPVGSTTAKFDLVLSLREHFADDGGAAGVRGSLEYSTDLFAEPTARGLADGFVRLLETVAADPGVRCAEIR